jgi:hypothetical protein
MKESHQRGSMILSAFFRKHLSTVVHRQLRTSEGSIYWARANHAILDGQEDDIAARKGQQLRPTGSRVRVHNLKEYYPINRAFLVT